MIDLPPAEKITANRLLFIFWLVADSKKIIASAYIITIKFKVLYTLEMICHQPEKSKRKAVVYFLASRRFQKNQSKRI